MKEEVLKRKLTVLLVLAAQLLPINISATGSTLVVELNNGEMAYFILSDKPVITPHGSQVEIESKSVKTSYERTDVVKLYFTDESAGINDVEKDDKNVVFSQTEPNRLAIYNLSEKDRIIVSNLGGRMYNDCVSQNSSKAIVDLENCPKGVYIIKIGNKQTIKMTKK